MPGLEEYPSMMQEALGSKEKRQISAGVVHVYDPSTLEAEAETVSWR